MIRAGVVTIYVSNLQRAIDFYTGTLGLRLLFRAENHWAQPSKRSAAGSRTSCP
jgi:catechol 2,3-dioxygenase-like lactoylglutathione lyase family enzyme